LISLGTPTTRAMLSPPYALIPQYLITGYYKPATILRSGARERCCSCGHSAYIL
jgi:hypothetical protein